VETFSYTKDDYVEMWLAYAVQRGFWATGFLQDTVSKIIKNSNIGYGDFIKLVVRDFLFDKAKSNPTLKNYVDNIYTKFYKYFDPEDDTSNTTIDFANAALPAPMQSSFMSVIYYDLENFEDCLCDWLIEKFPYLKFKQVKKEVELTITAKNISTSKFKKTRYIKYMSPITQQYKNLSDIDFINYLFTQMETYTRTSFLRGRVIGI